MNDGDMLDVVRDIIGRDAADPCDPRITLNTVYLALHGHLGRSFEWAWNQAEQRPEIRSGKTCKQQGG